jgi:hypothetical protein
MEKTAESRVFISSRDCEKSELDLALCYRDITAGKVSMLGLRVVTPRGLQVVTNVSEKLVVTVFMARFSRLSHR